MAASWQDGLALYPQKCGVPRRDRQALLRSRAFGVDEFNPAPVRVHCGDFFLSIPGVPARHPRARLVDLKIRGANGSTFTKRYWVHHAMVRTGERGSAEEKSLRRQAREFWIDGRAEAAAEVEWWRCRDCDVDEETSIVTHKMLGAEDTGSALQDDLGGFQLRSAVIVESPTPALPSKRSRGQEQWVTAGRSDARQTEMPGKRQAIEVEGRTAEILLEKLTAVRTRSLAACGTKKCVRRGKTCVKYGLELCGGPHRLYLLQVCWCVC